MSTDSPTRESKQAALVRGFLKDLPRGGAVAGLEAVATALQQGRVRVLLVRDGYAKLGRCCPSCGRLSVDHRSCPRCFRATLTLLDVVAELAERAAAAGVKVVRVGADPGFDAAGRIGARLSVPAEAPRAEIPVERALRALFAMKRAPELRPRAA